MGDRGLGHEADKSVAYPGHTPACFAELEVLGQVGKLDNPFLCLHKWLLRLHIDFLAELCESHVLKDFRGFSDEVGPGTCQNRPNQPKPLGKGHFVFHGTIYSTNWLLSSDIAQLFHGNRIVSANVVTV